MKKEDIFTDDEYLNLRKEEIQKDNAYFYELDPHGDDVQCSYSILPVRPYSNLSCLKIAIINHSSAKIWIKVRDNIEKVKLSLVRATVLMKFALTIENNSQDFLRHYQILYEPKLLKEKTSWSVRYIDSDYKFIISTGAEIGDGELKLGDVKNRIVPIWGILHSQICNVLAELKKQWPEAIYENLISELHQIGLSNNSQHL